MAKGYWIAHIDVKDDRYQAYIALSMAAVSTHGGQFLTRGPGFLMEGKVRARHVIVEFPTYEQAISCYRSNEYQSALAYRMPFADADLVVVKGV